MSHDTLTARAVPAVLAATTDAGLTHPATRAIHAVNQARQIAAWLPDSNDGTRIGVLLADVPDDIAALADLLTAQAEELAEMRAELCDMARANVALESLDTTRVARITELNTRLASAAHVVEILYLTDSMDLARHTERFNAIVRLRDELGTAHARPTPTTDTRRTAAGDR